MAHFAIMASRACGVGFSEWPTAPLSFETKQNKSFINISSLSLWCLKLVNLHIYCQIYIDIFFTICLYSFYSLSFSLAKEQKKREEKKSLFCKSHFLYKKKKRIIFTSYFKRLTRTHTSMLQSAKCELGVYMRGSGGSGCWICCGWRGGGSCRASRDSKPWPCGGGVPSALEGSVMSPP